MDIYKLQSTRRSIRKFTNRTVKYDLLEKFVDYARLSASANNLQPTRYYIVYKNKTVDAIFNHVRWAGYLKGAHTPSFDQRPKAYILFLHEGVEAKNIRWDIGAAGSAMQLMAVHEGLGTCWMAAIDRKEILDICSIDEKYSLDSLLAIGYPAESPVAEKVVDGNIKYYLDENKTLHVPKLSLEEVLIK